MKIICVGCFLFYRSRLLSFLSKQNESFIINLNNAGKKSTSERKFFADGSAKHLKNNLNAGSIQAA
jgi:hypothetical protein